MRTKKHRDMYRVARKRKEFLRDQPIDLEATYPWDDGGAYNPWNSSRDEALHNDNEDWSIAMDDHRMAREQQPRFRSRKPTAFEEEQIQEEIEQNQYLWAEYTGEVSTE